jgi:secretion/DNA translocation related TadE-like protein
VTSARRAHRPLRARPWLDERGAGTVLAIALLAVVVVFGVAGVSLGAALSARQRVIGAADLAALAAADAASGAIGGAPCDVAAAVARGNGAGLAGCRTDGLVVTVEASGSFAGIPISARSSAGPSR